MKIRFNLISFGIDTSQKRISDNQGQILVTATLESILSLITSKYLYNIYETVEINHTKFANITSDYRKYLNFLREKGVILISESYKKGEHSKSYMFNDYFKEYSTVKSFKVDPKDELKEIEVPLFLIDKMVIERIQKDYSDVKIKSNSVEKEIKLVREGHSVVEFKSYLLNEYGLFKLRHTPRVLCWKSGRFYSPFVQLSKDVRRDHLNFETQLTSLDIKRSFPLWLSVWLVEKGIPLDYDTIEFLSSVLTGNIYTDLIGKFNANKNQFNNTEFDKPFIDRNQVKELFGTWLNGNNNLNNLPNLIFKVYYPSIFDFVKSFKGDVKDRMYFELVTMETNFIFNKVCKRFYDEIPGIQLLTCHDEIYFEERYSETALKIWDEELELVYSKIPSANYIDCLIDDFDIEVLDI